MSIWHAKARFIKSKYFLDESGNVESALVIIPLMILFLTIAQLALGVYARDSSGEIAQGATAFEAMGQTQQQGVPLSNTLNSGLIAMPLPGGGSILVGQLKSDQPAVSPLLPNGDNFQSTGIAVQE